MKKLPNAVEEFLECRINACDELDPYLHSSNKLTYMGEIVKSALDEVTLHYKRHVYYARVGLYSLLLEPLKNAVSHTNPKLPHIEFSLILSSKALVANYFDENGYFKKSDARKKLEERITPIDLIHLDKNTGKLYLGVSVKNPEFFSEMK